MAESPWLAIEVAYAPQPRTVLHTRLRLPAGSTVAQAIAAAQWHTHPEVQALLAGQPDAVLTCGIWGKKTTLDHVLRDHDRVELYRPLQVDPKLARRERFGKQGARTAGLFAQRRPGAKPGY